MGNLSCSKLEFSLFLSCHRWPTPTTLPASHCHHKVPLFVLYILASLIASIRYMTRPLVFLYFPTRIPANSIGVHCGYLFSGHLLSCSLAVFLLSSSSPRTTTVSPMLLGKTGKRLLQHRASRRTTTVTYRCPIYCSAFIHHSR